jgi:hypothetical protein
VILAAFFTFAAFAALVGLALVDPRTVPPVGGACALILTVAALTVTFLR